MRRLLWLTLIVCLAALPLQARERAWGFCTQGGVQVFVSNVGSTAPAPSFAKTFWQQSYPNCTVTVYLTGTTTLATLYSDNSSTPLTNPFTANSNGYWRFYADAGRYDVRFSGTSSGISTPFTIADIELCDFTSETCSVGGGGGGTTPHNLLSATHPDTVIYSPPVPGDQILGGLPTGQKWQRFAGNSATTRKFESQIGDGTNVLSQDWIQIGGDCGALPITKLDPDTGAVTCGAAAANATYQHNDVTVATQPILDFGDSSNITWTVTNDPANNRVKAVPTANTTPSCNLAQQVDWYVNSTTGLDTNDGSIGAPWQHIQHAIDTGVPAIVCGRYIIHLAAGTYAENLNIQGRVFAGNVNPNISTTNNTEWPFSIDGGAGITSDSWKYSWIEILGSTAAPSTYILNGGGTLQTAAINNANVAFRGVQITNSGNVGIGVNGQSVLNIAGDTFIDCQTCIDAGYGARIHSDHSGTVNNDTVTIASFTPTTGYQNAIYLHDGAYLDDADWEDTGTVAGTQLAFNLSSGSTTSGRAIRVKSGSQVHLYTTVSCTIKGSQSCFYLENGTAEITGMTVTGSGSLVTANFALQGSKLLTTGNGTWTINNATQGIQVAENSTVTALPTGTSLIYPLYFVSMVNNPADGGVGNIAYISAPTQSSLITQTETVAFNSSVTFNMYLGGTKYMILSGNSALSSVTHHSDGSLLQTILCQDSAGAHTFGWPVNFVNPPTISSAALTCSINQFVYLATTNSWYTAGGGSGGSSSGFAYLGTWNSGTSYSINNIVSLTGSSYIALSSNIGIQPGTDGGVTWAVLAAAGAQGPAGPAGLNGTNGTDGAPGAPGYSPNQVLSGCGVAYASGLTFNVSACSYIIQGTTYGSAAGTATLTAADATFDRIDAIVVNTSGAIAVVTGTPSATPAPPSIDISSQLQLTFAYVAAGASTPSNIVTTDIYHENAEWTCNATTHVNCASTSNPHSGTKDIEWTSSVSGNNVTLTIPAGNIDLATRNNLVFWIRSKATWPSTTSIIMQWFNGTTAKCTPVSLANGNFGFSSSNTTTYQQIVVPTSVFSCNGIPVTRIRFQQASSTTLTGFYLDDIILQGGVASSSGSSAMNWKGAWLSSTTYAVNDTVTYNNLTYTAIQTNTSLTPSSAPGSWSVHSFSVAGVAGNLQYNNGTNILGALNTSITGSDITFPGIVYAAEFRSTNTIDNTSTEYDNGSGGDSTCPTPVAGKNFLCNQSNVLNLSNNGGAYSPVSTSATTTVNVNGSPVSNPNFNATVPAAPGGNTNVTFQVSGSSVSGYVPAATAAAAGSNTQIQNNCTGVLCASADFTFDPSTQTFTVGGSTGGAATLKLYDATTHYLGIAAPSSITTYTVTMPSAQAAGVLTNDGSGNLSWAASSGGDVKLLATCTVSGGASLDCITRTAGGNLFQSDYDHYKLDLSGVVPATNSVTIGLHTYNGSVFDSTTTNYGANCDFQTSATAEGACAIPSADALVGLNASRVSNAHNVTGSIEVFQPLSTDAQLFSGDLFYFDTSGSLWAHVRWMNHHSNGAAITGFQLFASSGNISGTIRVYGYAH